MSKIKAGDIVMLKSGSKFKTVESVKDDVCYCIWEENGKIEGDYYVVSLLCAIDESAIDFVALSKEFNPQT